nr:LLM class flavin-dependent oxidoreductase [Nesterenkonia massiliensis]
METTVSRSIRLNTVLNLFDLVPRSAGQRPEEAMAASLELARRAEDYGYHRLWFGKHHLNPGVMGYSPALMMALAGSVTTRCA